jgi:hypothetical protein
MARGVSRGEPNRIKSSHEWAIENMRWFIFYRPYRSLNGFDNSSHGFAVGYYLPMLARKFLSGRATAFFKYVVAFPVAKLGKRK